MGDVDQAIAGIVEVNCRGSNIVSYAVGRLLKLGEKACTVAICELVEGFQKGRQGGEYDCGIGPRKCLDYWIGSGVINQLAKCFKGKQGFGPSRVKIAEPRTPQNGDTAKPELHMTRQEGGRKLGDVSTGELCLTKDIHN